MKTLVCLALFIPALVAADDRLRGTWEGFDPVDEATLILTFSEDGTFAMSSPQLQGEAFSFENMFEDILTDLEMSLADLEELGFEAPTIDRVSIAGTWAAEGDSIQMWLTNMLIHAEGQPTVGMDQLMVDVFTQIASLPIEEELADMLELFIALIPTVFSQMFEDEELFIEGTYSFQDDQLVLISDDEPLVLSRLDGLATAVEQTTWGQIKALRP